jgi:tyrosyl-DNA phosphodiesterase 2
MPDLQKIIALIESKRKTSLPWSRQEVVPQPYYTFKPESQSWEPSTADQASASPSSAPITFNVLSWNIDFMLPFEDQRMTVALNHLHELTIRNSHPSIIFLNEMLESDLLLIQTQPWIRSSYHVTDLDKEHWESGHYGTTTLIHHALPISRAFRVHYSATKMERDGLFVDLNFTNPERTIRLCNTHLESLIADPPLRPAQVETTAKYLHEFGITGGIMGGDFNAIQPFDRTLHSDNNLKDAFLEHGGKEDDDAGYTWGQMAPVKQREMFGCSRMDKLFFCGDALECIGFERFGLGVKVEDKAAEKELIEVEGMDGGWVTDHAGVWGVFKVIGGDNEKVGQGKSAAKM